MRKPDWATDDGSVQLHCCDCLELLPQLEPGSVDAVVTDPPYAIDNQFGSQVGQPWKGNRRLQFDWDTAATAETVAAGVAGAMAACRKPFGAICFVGLPTCEPVRQKMLAAGLTVKMASWVKACPAPALPGNWWPSAFELALYGYQSGAWFGDNSPTRRNVWTYDSYRYGQPGKVDHPTQKPLGLIRQIIESMVPVGGIAIDPFMGSGTTGVACVRRERRFIGCDNDPRYFEIAVKRIGDEINRFPLFEPKPARQGSLLDQP